MPNTNLLDPGDLLRLVRSSLDLSSDLDLKAVLASILSVACELTDSPDGSVIVPDSRTGGLYFAHAVGENAGMLLDRWGFTSTQRIPTESVAGKVFVGGTPNVVQDAKVAGHFDGVDQETGKPTGAMMCVLLEAAGERLGVIQILNKRVGNYDKRDLILLEHFAAQASLTLRNAQLVSDLLASMGFFTSHQPFTSLSQLRAELNRSPKRERLSVLMADMRGFTRLCGELEGPERAYEILNQHAGVLADSVIDAGGTLQSFMGDGVMALFRGKGFAENAVRAAFMMTERFDRLKAQWSENLNFEIPYVDIGIGITTDEVVVGTIGSGRVRDLTVVGSSVNLANRYQESARNGRRVIVDKMTLKGAKDVIGEFEGPIQCVLGLPGETAAREYPQYLLKSLKISDGSVPAKPSPKSSTENSAVSAGAGKSGVSKSASGPSVFVSYSHKDSEWLEKLQIHLKPLMKNGKVSLWNDRDISPGSQWKDEISKALDAAKVGVLLVSPNFLASDFIAEKELPNLLNAAEEKGLKILWMAVSASSYKDTDISRYQAALDPSVPLDSLSDAEQNAAMVKFCDVLKSAAKM